MKLEFLVLVYVVMMTSYGEKVKHPSVVRRTKKNGNRAQNRELRQSIHEICDKVNDFDIDDKKKPTRKLQRSHSVHRPEPPVKIEKRTNRELLSQYVANTHNIDIKTIDWDTCTRKSIGDYPIHFLIEDNDIQKLALYLLANEDTDLEQVNQMGQTPLMYAVCIGDTEALNLLVNFGSLVNTKDAAGVTALRYAVKAGDFEIASILIENGASAETVQNGF